MSGRSNSLTTSTIRKCVECGASKDAKDYYAKTANRLDTVCKDCRKKFRNARYKTSKKDVLAEAEKKPDVILDSSEKNVADLSCDEFRNLVDAFSILLRIDRRLKGEE